MTYQCDVCGKVVPLDEIKCVVIAGLETDVCKECRGEDEENKESNLR